MKSSTSTIAGAMQVLSVDIQTQAGIANAALREAAERLTELHNILKEVIQLDKKQKIDTGVALLPKNIRKQIQDITKE